MNLVSPKPLGSRRALASPGERGRDKPRTGFEPDIPQKYFPGGVSGKESTCNEGVTGDARLIPGLGRSYRGGNGNPVQYSSPENPTDRGPRGATVHGVAKSRTRLSD